MKKIILSLAIVAAAGAIVIGATTAYFSDTETSSGNTISAGTIDIKVDGQNPWTKTYTGELNDMKPCETRYIQFTVKNRTNSNPVRVWKHLGNFATDTGELTEPECTSQGGTWSGDSCSGLNYDKNSLHKVVTYDMSVCKVGDNCDVDSGTGELTGNDWHTIISPLDNITLNDISSAWIDIAGFLTDKTLLPGEEIVVVQSYHISPEAGNEYQGDTLSFNIDILAQQANAPEVRSGTLLMENKDSNWDVVTGDGIWGVLKFDTSDSKFDYTFKGHGLNPNTGYSLIYYPEPQTIWPHPITIIDTMSTDVNGDISKSNNPDINMDLKDAKIWLVVSNDLNSTPAMAVWPPTQNMFYEYNLIDYEDTDN